MPAPAGPTQPVHQRRAPGHPGPRSPAGLRHATHHAAQPGQGHDYLRVQQIAGLPKEAGALALQVSQNKLLQKLLSQAGQLRITPENHSQFSALLPAPLRTLFRSEHVLLRSLAANDQVLMLLVADQGCRPLADISVQAFGKTAQCIERALSVFTNRKG